MRATQAVDPLWSASILDLERSLSSLRKVAWRRSGILVVLFERILRVFGKRFLINSLTNLPDFPWPSKTPKRCTFLSELFGSKDSRLSFSMLFAMLL
jgi:hypothetical protein